MVNQLCRRVSLASVLILTAVPNLSQAAVYDDFNVKLWIQAKAGTGPSTQQVNDRLEVSLPANSLNDPTKGSFGAGYVSSCRLTGDFDIQAEFSLLDFPANNGVRLALGLGYSFLETDGLPGHVGIASFGNSDISTGKGYYSDTEGGIRILPTTATTGILKLTRYGTLLTGYYYNSSTQDWVMIGTSPTSMQDASFYLAAWSHDAYFANQPVRIAFDNVAISEGTCYDPYAMRSRL